MLRSKAPSCKFGVSLALALALWTHTHAHVQGNPKSRSPTNNEAAGAYFQCLIGSTGKKLPTINDGLAYREQQT